MRVLVVAPTSREYKYMRATLDALTTPKHDYTLICSGIGKAGAAAGVMNAIARAEKPFEAVAVIGFAAGSADFKQGDVVAPARTVYHDCDVPEGFTLGDYVYDFMSVFANSSDNFKKLDEADSTLGKNKAIRYKYSFDRTTQSAGGDVTANITAVQYFAQHGSDVVVLSLFCDTSKYNNETYIEMFEQIRTEFVFCDKKEVNDVVTDKKTPEGMKKASFKDCEYAFYVPMSWNCNMSDKMTEAYYPESGKPNVTVTSFSPDEQVTPEQYFDICEQTYQKDIPGYEKISEQPREVAGCKAVSYTYKAVYGSEDREVFGQTEYRIMQTVFVYNDLIYSVTYTALADSFEAHLDDVAKMLDAFRFR